MAHTESTVGAACEFRIGDRRIADDAPVFVIAELSANHGQKLDVALRTIEAAKRAGVDAIKLQTYTPDTLTLRSERPDFVVNTKNEWNGRLLHDLYNEAMTPWEWHRELFACAESLGLVCFSTPFDVTAIDLLESLNAQLYKLASFELVDTHLAAALAHTGKPVIASTGMATLPEIEELLQVFDVAGASRPALLKCVSAYPASPASMNLSGIAHLKSLGLTVGLSDHTKDATAAIAAVALGARILEKHFILDRSMGGPDAFFSLEPEEMRATVQAVRDAQAAVGRPVFGPTEEEKVSVAFRRSIYATRDIAAGEVLTAENLRSVRPSFGLAPRDFHRVLGKPASHPIGFADRISLADAADVQPSRDSAETMTQDGPRTRATSGAVLNAMGVRGRTAEASLEAVGDRGQLRQVFGSYLQRQPGAQALVVHAEPAERSALLAAGGQYLGLRKGRQQWHFRA